MASSDKIPAGRATGRHAADDQLAALLASGLPVKTAAKIVHMSERTAHRRLDDAAFAAHVDSLRSRLVGAALCELERGMTEAALVLRSHLSSEEPHVSIRAASELLKNALRVRELTDFADRLERIERYLEKREL